MRVFIYTKTNKKTSYEVDAPETVMDVFEKALGRKYSFTNDGGNYITDNYHTEEGSDRWSSGSAAAPAEDVKDVTSDTKAGTTTA